MAKTEVRSEQIGDGQVKRNDLATTPSGAAVVRKIIQGENILLSSTGADAGTGDVTVTLPAAIPRGVIDYLSDTRPDYVHTSALQDMAGMTRTLAMIAGRRYRFTGHATFKREALLTFLDFRNTHLQIVEINAITVDANTYTISDTVDSEGNVIIQIADNGDGTWSANIIEPTSVYGILAQDGVEIGRFGAEPIPEGHTSQYEASTIYSTTTGNHVYTLRTDSDRGKVKVISSAGVWMLIEDVGAI